MLIYKLLRSDEWAAFKNRRVFEGAPIDIADGYIHFSTARQVRETAAKHFAGVSGLWLLTLDAEALGADLRWEPSRGGQLFPHLYRSLHRYEVLAAVSLPLGDNGAHQFPEDAPE